MTITLELTLEVEAMLRRKAERAGQEVAEYLHSLVERETESGGANEEQRRRNQAALEMLDAWDAEDRTDSAEELARRAAEWQEFQNGMNEAHSSSGRQVYP